MGAFLSPINWVAGVTIPINGDITILTNNCYRAHLVGDTQLPGYLPSCLCQLPHAKRRHADLPQCQQSAIQRQHRDAPGRWRWKKLNIRLMVQKSQGQPPGMYETLKIVRYLPYHLVQNFFHQPYVWYMTCILLGESLDTTIKNTALLWTWNSNPAQMCVCDWKPFVEKDVTWAKASGEEGILLRSTLGTSQLAMKVEINQDSNGQGQEMSSLSNHPFPPESRACSAAISKGLCPFSVILSGEARSWQLPAGGQVIQTNP